MFAPRGRYYDSSDDESGDESHRRQQPRAGKMLPQAARPSLTSAAAPAADDKKKKKIKLPPQESIDKIWERFSKKQFSKALNVLPFEPVPPSASAIRDNELLVAGYERAAEECRQKVRKIIQECKRVNTRYRDPGFDLDWDLKWEKGHCLNYLGKTRFSINSTTLQDPTSQVPKCVKRVHEIFENPTFMKNVSGSDIKQGCLGDCWFIASLSGLANVEDAIKRCCVEYNTRIGIYGFVFYRDGEWIYSIIDDKLYLKSPNWDDRSMQRDLLQQIDREEAESVYRKTYQTGSKALFFCQNKDQNETWAPLIEKAYAKAHGDYASLSGGWIGEGIEDLSGGVTTELLSADILDTDAFWDDELSKVNQEFLFGCSTGLLDGGTGDRNGIQERHAYNVVEARTLKDGTRLVKLRNPWGAKKRGIWEGPYSDGSKEWNKDVQEELGHSFGSDSVFWITYDDMLRKFQHLDRSRLFRDAGWRCCQRWIGVDVPWLAQYNEKFHIKLTVDSPLVLALSQLDKRYFKGLQGQYLFDLHFRVHEQGKPEAQDYIVRSHGNYLMMRSVGVELPSMPAGNYSIWISVTAERMTGWLSVEDVVKREAKTRDENDKLAQSGRAYDLAHSKAATHLAEVARRRKSIQSAKDCDERKKERRKAWAKRHIQSDIQKAQQAKNREKKERRKAERRGAAERRAAEEAVAAAAAKKEREEAEAAAKKKKEAEAESGEKKSEGADTKKDGGDQDKKSTTPADEKKTDEESKSAEKADSNDSAAAVAEKSDDGAPKKDQAVQTDNATKDSEAKASSEKKATEEAKTTDGTKAADESKPAEQKPTAADSEKLLTPQDHDKAETGSTMSSNSGVLIDTPLETPRSETGSATPAVSDESSKKEEKVPVPPIEVPGGPPATPTAAQIPVICQYHKDQEERMQQKLVQAQQQRQSLPPSPTKSQPPPSPKRDEFSADDSSDSPVSDWEDLYSSDDEAAKKKPPVQLGPNGQPLPDDDETEDETRPEPWNAVCILGFRVYSQDENLELRVVMEGGDLEEGGMGEKGEQDLDNAQVNAGGAREKKKDEDKEKKEEEEDGNKKDGEDAEKEGKKTAEEKKDGGDPQPPVDGKTDGLAPYPTIVSKGESEFEKASQPVVSKEKKDGDANEEQKVAEEKKKDEKPTEEKK